MSTNPTFLPSVLASPVSMSIRGFRSALAREGVGWASWNSLLVSTKHYALYCRNAGVLMVKQFDSELVAVEKTIAALEGDRDDASRRFRTRASQAPEDEGIRLLDAFNREIQENNKVQ